MNSPQKKYTGGGLEMPDLRPHFKYLHWRPMPHSFGVEVASDWSDKADDDPVFGLYKNCGLWTMQEAAILYNAAASGIMKAWVDIGAHTGWTSAHLIAAGQAVEAVDPMFAVWEFEGRFCENTDLVDCKNAPIYVQRRPQTANQFFMEQGPDDLVNGFVIDGDHQPGKPLEDAMNAVRLLANDGVILFHDFMGQPVRDAVRYLIAEHSMLCRVYLTPHCVAVCWFPPDDESERAGEGFVPPYHIPDPNLVMENLPARWTEMNWRGYL